MKDIINLATADIGSIFGCGGFKFIFENGKEASGMLNKTTPIFYDNGATGSVVTALIKADESINVKDKLMVDGLSYEITKIEKESQILNRLFLRDL